MSVELIKHREPLNRDELVFLIRKEHKDRKQFFKVVRLMMIFCFVCPFAMAWFRAAEGAKNPFSYFYYFVGVLFLLCFIGVISYLSYFFYLRKLQSDIRHKTKTIERTFITRKQYMPQNNTYFFYLSSEKKLSIEVDVFDYDRLREGDEVHISYTTYSGVYLGYS